MEKFQNIIRKCIKESISDIYITGGHPLVSRHQGNIRFNHNLKFSHQEVDDLARQLLNPGQLMDLREKKSYDLAVSLCDARLRINVFTTARGLSLAIRVLPGHIPTIDELNLHPSLHEISKLKDGLVLCCGPTGIGKSTTIAAIINEINNSRPSHIVTLENPIEYRFPTIKAFIQQRELGSHMPSFSAGLIDVLRENPDVIVVGELRETDVAPLTINAAEAGHLVIATLHASTPEEAIYRLCNSVPFEAQEGMRNQLAATLKWLIVQQLVHIPKIGFRVPLLSIVRTNTSVKNIIRENKLQQLQSVLSTGKSEGMFTSERYLNEYLNMRQKFTHPDAIFRPSTEKINDPIYRSPLVEDTPEIPSMRTSKHGTKMEPGTIRKEYTSDSERVLQLDESSESLYEITKQLREQSGE